MLPAPTFGREALWIGNDFDGSFTRRWTRRWIRRSTPWPMRPTGGGSPAANGWCGPRLRSSWGTVFRRSYKPGSTPTRWPTPGLFPPAGAPQSTLRFKASRPVGVLTAAGELVLRRRYYWGAGGVGGCYPSDQRAGIDAQTVSAGARELCCIMGLASDFRAAAANLKRVGGLCVCRERLRQIIEGEAAAVAAARDAGVVRASWSARTDVLERDRVYVGVDGLLVRTVTQAEKDKRRRAHAARRRSRGKAGVANARPLAAPRPGTDQAFKEGKFGVFYDQPK